MNTKLQKFQSQSVTVYDKNGSVIPTYVEKRKNSKVLFIMSLFCVLCLSLTAFMFFELFNDEPKSPVVQESTMVVSEDSLSDMDRKSTLDTSMSPDKKIKKNPELCGSIVNKGFDTSVDGKNYWFEIKDNKTGNIVKVNDIPNIVWTYSDEKTEFCK
jgi:hypothetical protein